MKNVPMSANIQKLNKVVAVIPCRLNSTRVPRKALLEFAGRPVIQQVIDRVSKMEMVDDMIVATVKGESNADLLSYLESAGIPYFKGSESDVLGRFTLAAEHLNADVVCYVGGDCPLISFGEYDRAIRLFHESDYDFLTNYRRPTYPEGLDINIISMQALRLIESQATLPFFRTNIFSYLDFFPDVLNIGDICFPRPIGRYHWALDTLDDVSFLNGLTSIFGDRLVDADVNELLDAISSDPVLNRLNEELQNPLSNHMLFSSRKIIDELLSEVCERLLGGRSLNDDEYRRSIRNETIQMSDLLRRLHYLIGDDALLPEA